VFNWLEIANWFRSVSSKRRIHLWDHWLPYCPLVDRQLRRRSCMNHRISWGWDSLHCRWML
jgi:hypothetical protein